MASALVEASVLGGPAACEKYGVTGRTLRRWQVRATNDPRLRRLYEAKMSRVDADIADSLTTRSALVVVRGRGPGARTKGVSKQAVRELADAASAEIVAVADLCGLPQVKSVERGHALPSGLRVSLLVAHRDGTYTVCEVLPAGSRELARPLGHLLFCYESLRMAYRLPASSVRLCVLSGGDAPPLWNRVAANVNVAVGFYNIDAAVRERLSTQNVLTSESAAAAPGSPAKEV
jgi:hypothetical protein